MTVCLSLLTSVECDDSNDHNEFSEWCKEAELQLNITTIDLGKMHQK